MYFYKFYLTLLVNQFYNLKLNHTRMSSDNLSLNSKSSLFSQKFTRKKNTYHRKMSKSSNIKANLLKKLSKNSNTSLQSILYSSSAENVNKK